MIQTQTIDIQHVKRILENCPHYDMIINYEYPYGDIYLAWFSWRLNEMTSNGWHIDTF